MGAKTHKEAKTTVFAYRMVETINSVVSLEISADDVIFVYGRYLIYEFCIAFLTIM